MKKLLLLAVAIVFGLSMPQYSSAQKHKQQKEYKKYNKDYKKAYKKREKSQYDNNRYEYQHWDDDRYDNNKYNRSRYHTKGMRRNGPPAWAPAHGYRMKNHVYFPDFYTFYDPYRQGYVYWNNGGWFFSPNMPGFMQGYDMNRARMQVMADVPLTTRPERYYDNYSRSYPSQRGGVNVNVNIPIPFGRR